MSRLFRKTTGCDFWLQSLFCLCLLGSTSTARGQIVPDGTLPNSTVVTPNGDINVIEQGTRVGGNLFHSFSEFSVPTGGEAFFNNTLDIQNIINRVTGGNISNIDGTIRANGTANLFLINPNGIIFGPNAKLNIGGSFISSTANRIKFADGSEFSATNPQAPPLLLINVPIGLQYGSNPGAIQVTGTGHNLSVKVPIFTPYQRESSDSGLRVMPGNTLALVGGDITISGGTLSAESGRIELGSVRDGLVGISPISGGWTLDYSGVESFGDIRLNSQALADVSGAGSGSIRVQAQNLEIRDGSLLWSQNRAPQPSGNISVNTSESIQLIGTNPNGTIRSGLTTEAFGGTGGDIAVSTKRLDISGAAHIAAVTYSPATAGNVTVNASESTRVAGVSPINPSFASAIIATTYGSGDGGNITLSTGRLTIMEGGATVSVVTFGSGKAGSVSVRATDSVEVTGIEPNTSVPSNITVSTLGEGTAGNLTLNTGSLAIRNGALVSAATAGKGDAGSVTVNASQFVEISGNLSELSSSSRIQKEAIRRLFGLPPLPSGNAGNLTINTPVLRVLNGSLVSVRSDAIGKAGRLEVNAGTIILNNNGSIVANSTSGEGGNVTLQVSDSLNLRSRSSISTRAGTSDSGGGDGGNISIDTPILVALENSDINANAFRGNGGRIAIATQGIFLSPDSEITASSQLGIDGVVEINTLEVDLTSGLVELPSSFQDSSQQISAGCPADGGNRFAITGRGGLPDSPNQMLRGRELWRDRRDLFAEGVRPSKASTISHNEQSSTETVSGQIVEAQGWIKSPDGTIILTAQPVPATAPSSLLLSQPNRCQS